MNKPVNDSEEFVYKVCHKSFLSLWSYANPRGKNFKELCDILIVCEPDIIILSVKDIKLTNSGDIETDWKRWLKKAIEDSAKQIYGAEKWIKSTSHIIQSDGTQGLPFPSSEVRRIHRIAVALGGDNQVPIQFGDFGKGFVHVFDKISFEIILKELDTITDFVQYLLDKENLYNSGKQTVFDGSEEDLLGYYLYNGRSFPENFDVIIVGSDIWGEIVKKPEYKAKKEADKESYVWDKLLEIISQDVLKGNLEFGSTLDQSELALRTMARECRFSRRLLGKGFAEFMDLAAQEIVESRTLVSPQSNVAYVFLTKPHGEDRQYRVKELHGRCFVVRGLQQSCKTVIGIATERYQPGKGFSIDVIYLNKEIWTEEDQKNLEYAQREFGWFASPQQKSVHEDEYPTN
ncbi:NERD domain-containing protein [Scytonema hofmannii FACHB-248]|uniref:NERD domain-containing protein n=1 Tax=Scytonema hofmannii FACHB-248 TaxID=1842502 RepID=A0ABR8GUA0_9CYAN|nr:MULTISPECIES: nuclease-related domain-containing protein [Nostocales]MBD2606313.1 NERD domain-containing protein [Scytonema hofmannii FACHB-248]